MSKDTPSLFLCAHKGKQMAKVQPRAWSMEMMRKQGFLCGMTEHWNSHTKRRVDLFGFIDFVAIGHGKCVAVQCCARSSISPHKRKIVDACNEAATQWLQAGNTIEIHGWDRHAVPLTTKDGTRLRRRVKVVYLVDSDL